MKKVIIFILCALMVLSVVSCGKKDVENNVPDTDVTTPDDGNNDVVTPDDNEFIPDEGGEDNGDADTIAPAVAAWFVDNAANYASAADVANALYDSGVVDYGCMVETFGKGDYYPGFSAELENYSTVTGVLPMIGSIPLAIYVFETDNVDALKAELGEKADPRWNICTEAKETVVEAVGNYVLLAMCPANDF